MSNQTIILQISLNDQSHPDEVDQATTQLYNLLRQSEAEHIEKQRSQTVQGGAKGDPITIGAIVLTISVPVVSGIMVIVNEWLKRRSEQTTVGFKLPDGREATFPISRYSSLSDVEAAIDRIAETLQEQTGA